ncbi:hypothetical protein [Flavobacterium sp. J27]|uniref:hypothetical protein n=1 Tax=Flavobacterium sp. J27 TaxID=2060419 RepID=UPI0010312FBD|nr:hypothetical protein [Flavobacterium sp. J27]
MIQLSKYIVILFALFLIFASFLLFFKPYKTKEIISKAGSTYFINYLELSIRLLVGVAFVLSSTLTKYAIQFKIVGYFLIISALILMFVPIKKHNEFSRNAAHKLRPVYLKIGAPFSLIIAIILLIAFKN